jgi:uncharacterized protein YacL
MLDIFSAYPSSGIFFLLLLLVSIVALVVSRRLLNVSFPYFFMGLLGLILGLIIGGLLGAPLSKLPGEFGRWLPLIVDVFVAVGMLDLFIAQTRPVAQYFERAWGNAMSVAPANRNDILVDTSVLIDGRIEQLVDTNFIMGTLVIPQFVLLEMQKIADSNDSLKRLRGRRGLDVLRALQQNNRIICEITQDRLNDKEVVDEKLVRLAKRRGLRLMTLDSNLARVAQIQSVTILNINELASSVRPLMVPGEQLVVKVVQKGKEKGQGVGYLPDGTMIVVEDGERYVGEDVEAEVTRIFQTVAGKMIFVQPKHLRTTPAYEKIVKNWQKSINE